MTESIALSAYAREIAPTDILDPTDLRPVLLGLYGEVGGIMSAAKKHKRDPASFPGYERAAREEFGDALWYLAALCRRLSIDLEGLFAEASSGDGYRLVSIASDLAGGACASAFLPTSTADLDARLFKLGRSAAALLVSKPERTMLVGLASDYLEALHGTGLSFANVVRFNLAKARGAFLEPNSTQLRDFDADFDSEEQLPRAFAIRVSQRPSGKTYLQWNGVFVGDPLTDNIGDPDGYRFHDVFHLANAAVLHWSPVMRALIKHKRKSKPSYDEAQDGGRAIVVEEGVTAWIFSQAKELDFFDNQKSVSLGLLKSIGDFVKGFEVDTCPLKLWERSILQGYEVFRNIRKAEGGWIVGNREERTVTYKPPEWRPM
ncbi:nucleoside triphosphate pyrophosphohydrolase family protein [Aquincola agrisoli]|uniref:nucleoside triphosphate pyrophosphohydrolase family protein n=1 Tax=Aquincola TaxID=391952 RepID=UPI00361DF6D5